MFYNRTEPQANIVVRYDLIFMFLDRRREDKNSGVNGISSIRIEP
jgi:hypothetical protein